MNLLVWRLSQWWRTSLDLSLHEFFFNYLISLNSSDTPINTKTTYANLINANLLKQTDFLINNSAFEIQVLSTLAIKCRGGSASALACLSILPRAMIWFLSSWDYLLYLIILFTYNTLERVKRKTLFTISLVDHLLLVSSCVLVIAGECIFQR